MTEEQRVGRAEIPRRAPEVRWFGSMTLEVAGRAGQMERMVVETMPKTTPYMIALSMTSGGGMC